MLVDEQETIELSPGEFFDRIARRRFGVMSGLLGHTDVLTPILAHSIATHSHALIYIRLTGKDDTIDG